MPVACPLERPQATSSTADAVRDHGPMVDTFEVKPYTTIQR